MSAVAGRVFSILFPDECRVCESPLRGFTRVPVCQSCLDGLTPFEAEFFCVNCRTPFVNAHPLDEHGRCGLCRLGLNGFDAAYSFGAYEGTLRKLVHLFKYAGMQPLARQLGAYLTRALPRDQRFDAIVPMPLHWWRRWRRGFNQSGLLAAEIARHTGLPVRRLVRRKRGTTPQAGLSNARRRANVAGAFAVRKGASLTGLRVLLVDDVMTTGATASACALALKRAGAAHVSVLTLARADRRLWVSTEETAVASARVAWEGAGR